MPIARQRHKIKSYPTPLPIDLIFYELRDSNLQGNATFEYGEPHPDTVNYPNHILVYVLDESQTNTNLGGVGDQKWYYAADRANQDLYNWEATIANIGDDKFDAVKRTYVFRRDDYDPEELQMGDPMPNIPVNRFPDPVTADGDNTTNNDTPPSYTNHVLAYRNQVNSNDPILASVFIVETRVYVKRCSITTIQTEDLFGIGGSKVDNLYYRSEVVDGLRVEQHFADPQGPYWGVQPDGSTRDGRQISENWFMISIINSLNDEMDDYSLIYPSLTSFPFPRILSGADVQYSVTIEEGSQEGDAGGYSAGTSYSSGSSTTDSCSSSMAISPEIGLAFSERFGAMIPSTIYVFFLPLPATQAAILAKLNALSGGTVQIYTPPTLGSFLITSTSVSVSVRASATAGSRQSVSPNNYTDAWNSSKSTDKRVAHNIQMVQVNNVVGSPSIGGSQEATVSAEASQFNLTSGTAGAVSASAFASASATGRASVTVAGGGGSAGTSSGLVLKRLNVEPYKRNYVKVYAEVVDLG